MRLKTLATAALALVAAAALAASASGGAGAAKPVLVVGGIHVGSVKDAGYNQAQHDGLM
jgi:basic membrane lipoprotein Med (substrate-binding protein (PBP1-ABC) superfamily)